LRRMRSFREGLIGGRFSRVRRGEQRRPAGMAEGIEEPTTHPQKARVGHPTKSNRFLRGASRPGLKPRVYGPIRGAEQCRRRSSEPVKRPKTNAGKTRMGQGDKKRERRRTGQMTRHYTREERGRRRKAGPTREEKDNSTGLFPRQGQSLRS
jgi:hypothetical protein